MKFMFVKYAVLILISGSLLKSEEKTKKQIDDDYVQFTLKLSDKYRLGLQKLLKKETTEIIIYSIGEPNLCESCIPDKKTLFDSGNLVTVSNNKSLWCPGFGYFAPVYTSTSIKFEKDEELMDEFFNLFSHRSNKTHNTASVVYLIHFLRDKEVVEEDANAKEILYASTISYNSDTLEFILPVGFSYGIGLDINEKLKKFINEKLPLKKGKGVSP